MLQILLPSANAPSPCPGSPLGAPLGSVLIVPHRGADGLALPEPLGDKHFLPWCPACLMVDDPTLPVVQTQQLLQGRRQVALLVGAPGRHPDPARVREAVRRREPPRPATLSGYVVRRTGNRTVRQLLDLAFSETASIDMPARSIQSRALAEFGQWTAREWRALAWIIRTLDQGVVPLDRAAWLAGLDPRSFEILALRMLGIPPVEAATLPGWEWKLEAALRSGGYPTHTTGRPTPPEERPSDVHQLI